MLNQQFRNIMYASDRSGTMKWRRIWPIQSIDCVAQQFNIQADYSQTPILYADYYRGMTSVTIQRWISEQQRQIVEKFLKPLCDRNSSWLIYEIDDAMHDSSIPLFNRGRKAFEGEKVQSDIKAMLDAADLITTTTKYIKDYYASKYGLSKDKIIAIPNLLPKYLFGDRYEIDKKVEQFKRYKAKPRIGIVSSLSHYNVDDVRLDSNGKAARKQTGPEPYEQPITRADGSFIWINEDGKEVSESELTPITDDMDEILDCIRSTVNDYQWVFFGFCPPKLQDLVDKKKIEVHGGSPIMNYASIVEQLQLQAIVAPIKDVEFNRCKSFIKYMEAAAFGVPLFASNCLPYCVVMPGAQLFNDSNDLKDKLLKLKFASTGVYHDMIERQWKWLNSPCKEGDFNIRNFWLEDNLNIWIDLLRLRQKTLTVSMSSFVDQFKARKVEEEKKKIFETESGMKITR